MRILVTGGTGFLGKHVVEELKYCGHDPIAVGSMDADLILREETFDLFREIQPDVVYHLAADVGGIQANLDAPAGYWYNNLAMGMNVLDTCFQFKVKKLIMVGTVCSYPKYTSVPFVEDELWDGYPEESNAPYGIAKKTLLVGAQAYREQFGLNTIFLMPANLYGPHDNFSGNGGHVIADLIRKFHTETPVTQENGSQAIALWGDGWATRDFLYAKDAARGICKAAELYNGSWPVNLGTGREINIRNLADLLKPICDFRGGVFFDSSKPNGQEQRCLDTSRAKALFGWQATTPLEKGLQATVDWYRSSEWHTSRKRDKVKVK